MMKVKNYVLLVFISLLSGSLTAQNTITDATFSALSARPIGPATTSGRVSCIDAVNSDPNILYVGAAGGGVWKSKNQGTTFKPIFDDFSQSIGCITIDQKHPDTVWVGTGEPWTRNSVSIGTGIYKTTDGGQKFELMGLPNSERIGKIVIDPTNSDNVYVAVLGALWSDSEERGVYHTTDGGKTWTNILYINKSTGCSSLAIDPENPLVLYAGMWNYRRTAYDFTSGGEGSGLYKSVDGGANWEKLVNDIPAGPTGRVTVAISPIAPYRIYALIESENSALYQSEDKGGSWQQLSKQKAMGERPFYFSNIIPDPVDPMRIYKPGFNLLVSVNGGKQFQGAAVEGGAYHSDLHALYISPKDNRLLYMGTDGGVYISRDRGNTWSHCENLPLAQFYHVSVDMDKPYNVYGGLQDNGSWKGPSSSLGGIQNSDWETIGIGDGFNAYADAKDPNIIYWQYQGGRIYRSNQATGEAKFIKPFPDASTGDLRYNWNTPVVFGKKTGWLYVGAQYLFRSKDQGDTWERISPDLTTNNPDRQQQEKSGGITTDNTSAENNTTIFSIAESALDANIIWVGTDDGLVQVTTDGGSTWAAVTKKMKGAPEGAFISSIDADNFNKGAAFVTIDAHRNGDMKSYVYYTDDYGKSWKNIDNESIMGYCHVIKQDLVNKDLLFLGTEFGLYLSIDHGKNWVRFKSNIPQVGVFDMVIHPRDHDLIIATHGRGIIIIDDITLLRNFTMDMLDKDIAFIPTKPFYLPLGGIAQDFPGDDEFIGPNPFNGARIAYYMKKRLIIGDISMELYDSHGKLINKQPAGNRKGINIVRIQTTLPPPRVPSSPNVLAEAVFGPDFEPGEYTVKLIKDKDTLTTTISINYNPATQHSAADRKLRHITLMDAYDALEMLAFTDKQILEIGEQSKILADSLKEGSMYTKALEISARMATLHALISATQPGEGGVAAQVRLREKIAEIYSAVNGYEGKPTNVQINALGLYKQESAKYAAEVQSLLDGEILKLNEAAKGKGLKPITVTSKAAFFK